MTILTRRDLGQDGIPATAGQADDDVITGTVVATPIASRRYAIVVVKAVKVVATHQHARRTAMHVSYIPLGAFAAGKAMYDASTGARFTRAIKAAQAAGDHAAAVEWETLLQKHRNDRHRRSRERRQMALATVKASPWIAGSGAGVLFGIGSCIAVAKHNIADVAVPFEVVVHVVMWVLVVISVSYGPFLIAAPWLALAGLWYAGRAHAKAMPGGGWILAGKAEEQDGGLVLTADTVVLALQHLPIPALRRASKDGWTPAFTTVPTRDGSGYSTTFTLPLGVTVAMVADQRPVLARNLHRDEVEVWPSAGAPGHMDLWVADSGAIGKMAPEYPLLHEGECDVFKGVPAGVTARGTQVMVPIVGNNLTAGGLMGQGKSNALRVVALGACLDPLCEVDVFVFANNGDFDAYAPRLAVYRKGIEDEAIVAAVRRLRELYEEVGRREARLAELGAKKVTRGLAQDHPDMRPIVALFSECHELFGHGELGGLAAELATKTIKRARKTGITLMFDTQSSRKEAIPPKLLELISVRCCFAVTSWRSNDGFLGDGQFQAGVRATELRPGRDRGTSLITGVSDSQFEVLKWFFIEVDDDTGYDAARDVIGRAMATVKAGTPVGGSVPVAEVEHRDLLADLVAVVEDDVERVKLADLPGRLRKLAPTWTAYADLTGTALQKPLSEAGIKVYTTGGTLRVEPSDIRSAATQSELPGD